MLHLLKEKSKVGIASKQRKRFDALMPVPKLKTNSLDFVGSLADTNLKNAVNNKLQSYPSTQTRNQINANMK